MNAEWIDASSKKPLPFERVLGFRSGQCPCVCYVNKDGDWFSDWHCNIYNVTHWMPLPEDPKRETSFEKWQNNLPSKCIGGEFQLELFGVYVPKATAKLIWDSAIAASKQPDFVE